jgi:pyruvate decarboxylase
MAKCLQRQLTVQELSSMMRKDLKPILFVLNNSGYTIERYLHGKTRYELLVTSIRVCCRLTHSFDRKYNDIVNWKWTGLLSVLGDLDGTKSKSYTVNTRDELNALLENEEFARTEKIQLVEIMMPMHDAPRALQVQAEMSGQTNKYVA